ncbi:NnrT protein [Cognatishimia sp. WU-CL00825]|uniref:NnrT protein n=1 Tax=Cognatishimia sp. WU-CL00825 TaxID=3127658 RepID=UPI0033657E2D
MKLMLALYPFGCGAMAVNAFFASLLGSWVGLPVLSMGQSFVLGALVAVPATWYFAKYIYRLAQEIDAP